MHGNLPQVLKYFRASCLAFEIFSSPNSKPGSMNTQIHHCSIDALQKNGAIEQYI